VSATRTRAKPWYAEGLRFECRRCRACCTGAPGVVMVSTEEVQRLAAHLGLSVDEFGRTHLRRARGGLSLTERANGDCVLLEPEGCAVYELRPNQCRVYPFWNEFLVSRADWNKAGRECPGINQGRLYPFEEIERLRDLDA